MYEWQELHYYMSLEESKWHLYSLPQYKISPMSSFASNMNDHVTL